jgi:hypothetical protein
VGYLLIILIIKNININKFESFNTIFIKKQYHPKKPKSTAYSSSHKYVPIGYKYISGIRTNHFDNFVNVLGEVKRKN